MSEALVANQVAKQYGRHVWALRSCSVTVPTGRVVALVGPNGAGKTTLLQLAAGLLAPSQGSIKVFGHSPTVEPKAVLPRIGFMAQEHPLYSDFTVGETLSVCCRLNRKWDNAFARTRLEQIGIPLSQRVGRLSGGQQAKVALVVAMAKRPELLLLDEPLASLDPLARRDFLRVMMEAAVTSGMTVVLSSHILSDLERVCDYLVVLTHGKATLTGDLEEIMRVHKRLVGTRQDVASVASRHRVVEASETPVQTSLLVRLDGPLFETRWAVHDVSLEDIVLAYLGTGVQHFPSPAAAEVRP